MMTRWLPTAALLTLSALAPAAMAAGPALSPDASPTQIVQQTADTLAERIEGRQGELAKNPQALYTLVDEVFLPVFDTDYAGRLVLGRHARTSTPEQRQRFVDAFYDFLLRSYAKYVLRFERDKVKVLPGPDLPPDAKRAVVRSEMQLEDGTKIPVNYSLHLTKNGWRAFDVRIEGISYVQNYRNQFNSEIAAKGIEAVIARLEADSAKLDTSGSVPGIDDQPAGRR